MQVEFNIPPYEESAVCREVLARRHTLRKSHGAALCYKDALFNVDYDSVIFFLCKAWMICELKSEIAFLLLIKQPYGIVFNSFHPRSIHDRTQY